MKKFDKIVEDVMGEGKEYFDIKNPDADTIISTLKKYTNSKVTVKKGKWTTIEIDNKYRFIANEVNSIIVSPMEVSLFPDSGDRMMLDRK